MPSWLLLAAVVSTLIGCTTAVGPVAEEDLSETRADMQLAGATPLNIICVLPSGYSCVLEMAQPVYSVCNCGDAQGTVPTLECSDASEADGGVFTDPCAIPTESLPALNFICELPSGYSCVIEMTQPVYSVCNCGDVQGTVPPLDF